MLFVILNLNSSANCKLLPDTIGLVTTHLLIEVGHSSHPELLHHILTFTAVEFWVLSWKHVTHNEICNLTSQNRNKNNNVGSLA
jgi:hypothetical protein